MLSEYRRWRGVPACELRIFLSKPFNVREVKAAGLIFPFIYCSGTAPIAFDDASVVTRAS